MIRYILSLIACIGILTTPFSAVALTPTDSTSSSERKNSLVRGSNCLYMGLNNSLKIENWRGYSTGFKHHISENYAYRIGLRSSAYFDNQKRSFLNREVYDINRNQTSLSLQLDMLRYPASTKSIKHYFAGGIISYFGAIYSESTHGKSDEFRFGIGPAVTFGLEWFAVDYFSMIFETEGVLLYHYEKRKNYEVDYNSITKSSQLMFAFYSPRLGMAFYF